MEIPMCDAPPNHPLEIVTQCRLDRFKEFNRDPIMPRRFSICHFFHRPIEFLLGDFLGEQSIHPIRK